MSSKKIPRLYDKVNKQGEPTVGISQQEQTNLAVASKAQRLELYENAALGQTEVCATWHQQLSCVSQFSVFLRFVQ